MTNTKRAFKIAAATLTIKQELAKQYGNKIYSCTEEQLYSYLDSCTLNATLQEAINTLNSL